MKMIVSNNLLIPPSYVSHSCPIIDLGGLNCMSSLLSGMSSGAKNIGQIINIMRSCQNRLKSIGDKRGITRYRRRLMKCAEDRETFPRWLSSHMMMHRRTGRTLVGRSNLDQLWIGKRFTEASSSQYSNLK